MPSDGARGVTAAGPVADAAGSVPGTIHSWDISTGTDGPGTRFVLFTAGCPLRCLYCHNPDTWRMRDGEETTSADVLARVTRYRGFVSASGGGVTVSGGEPLLQPAFTTAVLAGSKAMGLHTALDTSGVLGMRADADLLAATDLVLLDIKAIKPDLYTTLTSGVLRPTLTFAERLAAMGKTTWVRFVLLPGYNDSVEHVSELASYVAGLGNVERVDVLGYHRLGREKYAQLDLPDRLEGVDAATAEQVAQTRDIFATAGLVVT